MNEANEATQLSEVLAELSRREPIFHRAEFGVGRADFEAMTADDFWEVGASGRCYSRTEVLDVLGERFSAPQAEVWKTSDFRCRKLAPDVYLLTYNLMQNEERRTRRATVWHRTPDGWKIVYHQGTVIQEA